MVQVNVKAALVGLEDADLLRIVTNQVVGKKWALTANVNYEELRRGRPSAIRGVRVAIMRRYRDFARPLAAAWEFLLDSDEVGDPDADVVFVRATMAGYSLGRTGARAMLYSLADDEDCPDASAVRERLEELLEAAEEGSRYDPADIEGPGVESFADEDGAEEAIVDADRENDDRAELDVDKITTSPTVSYLEHLHDHATSLHDEAAPLVNRLRAAAELIERGIPASAIGSDPDDWSAAVRILLAETAAAGIRDVITLPEAVEALQTAAEERAQQQSERRTSALLALQMIDLLRNAGRDDMIPDQLALHGFATVQEVEEAAGAQSEQQSGPDPDPLGPNTGTAEDEPDIAETGEVGSDATAQPEGEASAPQSGEIVDPSTSGEPPSPRRESAAPRGEAIATAVGGDEVTTDEAPSSSQQPEPSPVVPDQSNEAAVEATSEEAAMAAASGESGTDVPGAAALEELVAPNGPLGEWPWDEGDPPAIAQLLLEGREALAYHMATAAAETQARQQMLLFACAAAHCSPTAIELSLLPSDADIKGFDTNESLLLLAASLRAGLRLGYAPLGLQSLLDAADTALADPSLRAVLHAAATAVQRGHGRRHREAGPSAEEMAGRWVEVGADAGRHLERLRQKFLRLQRGSNVLRHLVRDGQPVADALTTAAALTGQGVTAASSPQWAPIEETAELLRDHGDRERLLLAADAAVSTAQQRTRAIDGKVKRQLDDLLREAGDVLSRVLTVRRAILSAGDLKEMAVSDDLDRALHQAPAHMEVHSVGEAAVANLLHWLRSEDVDPAASSVQDVVNAALLELYEISRDEQGRPKRSPNSAEIAQLLTPRDPDLVVSGYLSKGDIDGARVYIAARGLEGAGYDDQIAVAAKRANAAVEKAFGEAEEATARLRALYKDDLARESGERIAQIEDSKRDDRYDLAIEGLRAIAAEAEDALAAERDALRARVDELSCDEATKSRVLARIDARDEPLAVYFLSVLQAGGTLDEAESPSGDDFGEFVPRIVDVAAAAAGKGQDAVAVVRESLQATAKPVVPALRDGLVAWQNLKTRRRSGDDFKRSLGSLLRMLGLIPKAQSWYRGDISRTTAGGYATLRVAANPVDRSYVPRFGSQALGEYHVTLVWDPASPSRLMDFIDEANRNRPNVILYFGVLSMTDRRHLRTLTRTTAGGKGFSPIVIDEAVIGWLSHLPEPGWRFTQRVTLPFTTLNPYQPNAAGEVPEEVFVGRSDERARIENPTGSMFVYGGRQLGKSALLKRVEHLYTDLRPDTSGGVSGKAAVYIDLKAAGIGEARKPAQLWPLLGEKLHQGGIIATKTPLRSEREVTAGILSWLNSAESNQLLLLLDEADNFLTADSTAGDAGVGGFPVLNALKAVMDQSHRRFKAVFAGLHQVQRFFDASNTPVAHGGDAIPIGPLRTHDACNLVVSPLSALGYKFENPELVWRLLLVTNYQASLVQIVCDELVRYLQKRQIPEPAGRMVITAEDVRAVCSDRRVRDLIAQRFRWTINLDSRYRVIALVVALNSIGAEPGVRFSVDELREWCEVCWPNGFSPDQLSRNEFERYLVEMQGLGILQQPAPDSWALRSPNIIQMLGTRDRLLKELDEAQSHLERPLEYNPTMARPIMDDSEGLAARRSPLTDHVLTALVKEPRLDLKEPRTAQVVFGSSALGIDRVVEIVARQAHRDIENPAIVVDSLDSPELRRAGAGGKRTHVIVDLTGVKPRGELRHICSESVARRNVTATVVIGPAWLDSLDTLSGVPVHKLRRWSTAGLRAWYTSPFDTPAERAKLHQVTSGWPKLVEEVMADFLRGNAPQEALERLAHRLAKPERARQFLSETAIDPKMAQAWVQSIPFSADDSGAVEQLPVTVDDITEALGVEGIRLMGRLEALDLADCDGEFWFMDRVVLAAAATLYNVAG